MSETINIDFIGAASVTETGLLEYRRLPIPKLFDEEMQTLTAMYENENRSVMDLQDFFQRFMPKSSAADGYDYCAPHGYTSSYIDIANYPKLYTFEEYQTFLKDRERLTTTNFLSECELEHVSELNSEQRKLLNEKIIEDKNTVKRNLKVNFHKRAMRYVQAHRFYSFLKKVKGDDRNKMYSTENIGWTTFNYPISDDILFYMKSNFGYGRSSYHFINLTYKGIDILPYSALVKYYYVNTVEFYRYTRQYRPNHENWEVALDFVVETANQALQDESEFVSKWIGNEIEEMVSGLKIISSTPKEKLQEFFKAPKKEPNFLFVRNAYKSDEEEYLAYPEEISTIFKAEKLTAALELLDKLKALSDAHPKALTAIEEIKALNIDFFPNLKEHIEKIEQEIKRRQDILKPKIEERDEIRARWKSHYDKMEELVEEGRKKGNYRFQEIRNNYFSIHPDFKTVYDDVEERTKIIKNDEFQISKREGFVKQLENCKNLISQHLEIAA